MPMYPVWEDRLVWIDTLPILYVLTLTALAYSQSPFAVAGTSARGAAESVALDACTYKGNYVYPLDFTDVIQHDT